MVRLVRCATSVRAVLYFNMQTLNIVGYFHLTVPEHNAGSETTVWAALRAMVQRGHQVTIVCDRSRRAPYTFEGINVVRPPRRGVQSWLAHICENADLLVTHLDLTREAMQLALDLKKPLAHFVHNTAQLKHHHVNTLKCQLAIFNSHWVAEAQQWPGPQIVVHPVVEPDCYRCGPGEAITLVNPTPGKGAATFYQLAQLLPDQAFITVAGAYGTQIACPKPPLSDPGTRREHEFYKEGAAYGSVEPTTCIYGLPNVSHLNHTSDIREVFRKTKILLMPSDYESYGRVGIEAACAGIPTIAHPTPGLKEAFGDAGIFYNRDDIAGWHAEIKRLLSDEIYFRKRADICLALAESLEPEQEFDRLEQAFLETVRAWRIAQEGPVVKMWTTDRRLYLNGAGQITDKQAEGVSLYRGVGGQIPLATAKQLGLVEPASEGEESDLNAATQTQADLDTKALSHPPENKAIESPEETKKRGRRKKEAA